jgi:hypothetical protein
LKDVATLILKYGSPGEATSLRRRGKFRQQLDAARPKSDTSIFAAQRQVGEIELNAKNGEKMMDLWCH